MSSPHAITAEPETGETRAVIALGSNLGSPAGSPEETVRQALAQLASLSAVPIRASSLYDTTPMDCPVGSGRFINAIALIAPPAGMTPLGLLDALQTIEKHFGRKRGELNAPRTLDLDLIAFGSEKMSSERLQLPHPRVHERRFVLAPLVEVAPMLSLPGTSLTVQEMLEQLPDQGPLRRLP